MTEIKFRIPKGIVMPDIWDWFEDNGLEFVKDWRWDRDIDNPGLHSFFIKDEKMATLFALRWL